MEYDKYPKQKMRVHSRIVLWDIIRNLLVTKELRKPHTNPTRVDRIRSFKKLPTTINGVKAEYSVSGPEKCITVLNRIMLIASFVIPSPNTMLNSFGC